MCVEVCLNILTLCCTLGAGKEERAEGESVALIAGSGPFILACGACGVGEGVRVFFMIKSNKDEVIDV